MRNFLFILLLALVASLGAISAPQTQAQQSDNNNVTMTRTADGRTTFTSPALDIDANGVVTRKELPGPAAPIENTWGDDPDVESGWPVSAPHGPGTYHAGAAINVLAGDVAGDDKSELFATALSTGPLLGWNTDGTPLAGFPLTGTTGASYPVLGNFAGTDDKLEVFAGHWGNALVTVGGNGQNLPGWPKTASNFVTTPGSAGDLDGDGVDESCIGEENGAINCHYQNRSAPWRAGGSSGGQERHTPAIADVVGGDLPEVFTTSGWTTPGVYLYGHDASGGSLSGFPVAFNNGHVDSFPVVGDVDGDGVKEIILLTRMNSYPWHVLVNRVSPSGTVQATYALTDSVPYGTAPALANLDSDVEPEIVVQTESYVYAMNGDGTYLPGWPRKIANSIWIGNSSPVIGDVDGDQSPDIVLTTQVAGSGTQGSLWALNARGEILPRFPKILPIGSGGVPAIGDFDGDGRNEIAVRGAFWNGHSGVYPYMWLYDLDKETRPVCHGAVEWGQFMSDSRHSGVYNPTPAHQCEAPPLVYLPQLMRQY